MITKFKAHGTDEIGNFTIEGDIKEYRECLINLEADPHVEDLWFEYYDDEEGWIA